MKFIILIIILLVSFSCRTASRSVEKHRESVESLDVKKKTLELKNDSVAAEKTLELSENQLIGLLSRINFYFSGKSSEDSASIQITQTKDGIKVNVIGSADATISSDAETKSETKSTIKESEGQLNQNKSENLNESQKSESKNETTDKEMKSKTTGFQFSFWIWVIIGTIVIICLWWFFGRPKGMKE